VPTQLQGDIDGVDVYEPIVQCISDGEVITSPAMADPLVSLGRRIDWVKNRVAEFFEDPFTVSEIKDDFSNVKDFGSPESVLISDSGIWGRSNLGAFRALTSGAPLDSDHFGALEWINDQGSAALFKQTAYPVGSLEKMICHVWIATPDTSTFGFEFGLTQGTATTLNTTGVHAFTAQWDTNNSANWTVRTGNTGGNTRLDTGAAVTFDAWNRLELVNDASTLKMRINGGAFTTAVGTLPTLTTPLTPILRFSGNSSSNPIYIDAVYWKFVTAGRGL